MARVGSGEFTYEYIQDFPKLPEGQSFGMGSGIATDSRDRLYVFQRKDPPVMIFDATGKYEGCWGINAIRHPHGLAISDDVVYITDRDDSVAVIFTLDGKPLRVLGERGVHSNTGCQKAGELVPRAAGPFNFPTKMRPGPSGNIYVTDGYRNCRVHEFASDGQLVKSWGQPGNGPGQFHVPHSIAVDPNGKLYVCDRANGRVQVFTSDGEYLSMWTDMCGPNDIARDEDGIFYICEQQEGRTRGAGYSNALPGYVSVRNDRGTILARWESRPAHGICVDSQGNIYLALPNLRGVDKYVRVSR